MAVNSGDTTVATYSYDGTGRRITETHGSTTTALYFSTAGQVLEEQVGGVTQARNVWSPVYVNAMVLRDQSSEGDGTLDQRLYVVQDPNWNVTALIDTSGNVVERYVYDPYGAVTVLTGSWGSRSSSSYNWLYLFQGGRRDVVSGLYHFGARDYSPSLSRWMETDPLGFAAGQSNLQVYVGNNPTNAVDPAGLDEVWIAGRPIDGSEIAQYTQWTGVALHWFVVVKHDDGTYTTYDYGDGSWVKNKPINKKYTGWYWQFSTMTFTRTISAKSLEAAFENRRRTDEGNWGLFTYNCRDASCQLIKDAEALESKQSK